MDSEFRFTFRKRDGPAIGARGGLIPLRRCGLDQRGLVGEVGCMAVEKARKSCDILHVRRIRVRSTMPPQR